MASLEKPRLAVTMGDPAGIGPEVAVRSALALADSAEVAVYGAPDILNHAAKLVGVGDIASASFSVQATSGLEFDEAWVGTPNPECGRSALSAVDTAVEDALAGKVDAVVTAPMCKESVNLAGIEFSGHTEYIAGLCGVAPAEIAMRQSAGKLRIAFVTTHIPLRDVAKSVAAERIAYVAELLAKSIREEGVDAPLLAVAGLNPHAGEGGFMGREDVDVVARAVEGLRRGGMNVEGPIPSDTLFVSETLERFDGVVAMYHDQGHIPFKMLAFDRGVNSTLGLPIIRTSPDHGVAFSLAWGKGEVNMGSMLAAMELAASKSRRRGLEMAR